MLQTCAQDSSWRLKWRVCVAVITRRAKPDTIVKVLCADDLSGARWVSHPPCPSTRLGWRHEPFEESRKRRLSPCRCMLPVSLVKSQCRVVSGRVMCDGRDGRLRWSSCRGSLTAGLDVGCCRCEAAEWHTPDDMTAPNGWLGRAGKGWAAFANCHAVSSGLLHDAVPSRLRASLLIIVASFTGHATAALGLTECNRAMDPVKRANCHRTLLSLETSFARPRWILPGCLHARTIVTRRSLSTMQTRFLATPVDAGKSRKSRGKQKEQSPLPCFWGTGRYMERQGATGHRRQRNLTCSIRISLWVVLHEDEVPWELEAGAGSWQWA